MEVVQEMKIPYQMIRGLAMVSAMVIGCGDATVDGETDIITNETSALGLSNLYWKAGTANPRAASCFVGDFMIGAVIDGDTAYVKCAKSNPQLLNGHYNGTSTLKGVNPACSSGTDAAQGWSENLSTGATSINCGHTSPSWTFFGDYKDGPGTGTWGQEPPFWVGHWVYGGHVCAKAGYVVRAYNNSSDLLVCGT